MAISVGEIEATLKLRDEFTKQINAAVTQLQQASAKVATLGSQFNQANTGLGAVAGSATNAGQAIAQMGVQAQQVGRAVQQNMAAAATALNQAATAAGSLANQSQSSISKLLSFGPFIKRLGEDIKVFGSNMTMAFTVPLVGAGTAVFKYAKDFEAAMLKVSTLSGVAAERIGGFRDEVLKLSGETAQTPLALAQALLVVTSTGLRGAEAMQILGETAKASAVGLGDSADIARVLTAAMVAYGKENLNASDAANKLFIAVREGGAEADGFARTLGRVVGIASQVGVSFDEILASVATFTRLGVRADEAVTGLRGTLATILKPSEGAREQLKLLGTSVEELRDKIQKDGLAKALIDLVQRANGSEDALAKVIPNVRALASVLGNTVGGGKEYAGILKLINDNANDLNSAMERQKQTLQFKWDQLIADLQKFAIALGDELMPYMNDFLRIGKEFIQDLGQLAQMFSQLPKPVQSAAIYAAAFLAVLGPIAYYVGSVVGAIGSLMTILNKLLPGWEKFFAFGGATISGWASSIATSVGNVATALGVALPSAATAASVGLAAIGFGVAKKQVDDYISHLDEKLAELKVLGNSKIQAKSNMWDPDPNKMAEAKKQAEAINAELGKIAAGFQYPLSVNDKVKLDPKVLEQYQKLGPLTLDAAKALNEATQGEIKFGNAVLVGAQAAKAAADPTARLREERMKMEKEIAGLSDAAKQEIFLAKQRGDQEVVLAQNYHVSEGAINTLVDRMRSATTETNKWAKANESMIEFLDPIEELGGAVSEAIKYYLDLGASQESLANWFGVSTGAVKKLKMQMEVMRGIPKEVAQEFDKVSASLIELEKRQREFNNKAFMTNITGAADAEKQAAAMRAKRSMEEHEFEIYQIRQTLQEKLDSLDEFGDGYQTAVDSYTRASEEATTDVLIDWRKKLDMMAMSFSGWSDTIGEWFQNFPKILQAAATGGGGLSGAFSAMFSQIGGDVGKRLMGNVASKMSNWLVSKFGVGATEVLGTVIPGIGEALGALAGPMIQKLWSVMHKPEWKKLAYDVGRDWGLSVSDGLAKEMEDDSKKFGRQVATLLNMDKIFKENGGINAGNFEKAFRMLHDVFSLLSVGQLNAAQAAGILDKNWEDMVKAGTDGYGFINDQLKELIRLNEEFGTSSEKIAAFLKGQGQTALKGISAAIGGYKKVFQTFDDLKKKIDDNKDAIDELNQKIKDGKASAGDRDELAKRLKDQKDLLAQQGQLATENKAKLEDLGVAAVGAFAAAIASGSSFNDAIGIAGDSLNDLAKAFSDLGIDTENPFLKILLIQAQIQKNNPELIQGINGLGSAFAGLANLGMLNADTFAAMQRVGLDMYSRLQDQVSKLGGDTKDALLPMQDYLHRAEKAARELGIPLDAATQDLIDQSKQLGIWKDDAADAGKTMQDMFKELIDKLDIFISKLMGIPKEVNTRVRVTTDNPDPGSPSSGGTGKENNQATPYRFGSNGLQDFGAGHLAMLHGKEGVYTAEEIQSIVDSATRPTRQGPTHANVTIEIDGRTLARRVLPLLPKAMEDYGIPT